MSEIVQAGPKPKPQSKRQRPGTVLTARKQEDFAGAGSALAKSLGWAGKAEHEKHGITVRDAARYLTKVLHEQFEHSFFGRGVLTTEEVLSHLYGEGEPTGAEVDLIGKALAAMADSGAASAKAGDKPTEHEGKSKFFEGIEAVADAAALGRAFEEASAAAKGGK